MQRTVAHYCRGNYKNERRTRQRYTQFSSQKLSPSRILSQYTLSEYFSDLIFEEFLTNISVLLFVSLSTLGSTLDEPVSIIHQHWRKVQRLIFCIITTHKWARSSFVVNWIYPYLHSPLFDCLYYMKRKTGIASSYL